MNWRDNPACVLLRSGRGACCIVRGARGCDPSVSGAWRRRPTTATSRARARAASDRGGAAGRMAAAARRADSRARPMLRDAELASAGRLSSSRSRAHQHRSTRRVPTRRRAARMRQAGRSCAAQLALRPCAQALHYARAVAQASARAFATTCMGVVTSDGPTRVAAATMAAPSTSRACGRSSRARAAGGYQLSATGSSAWIYGTGIVAATNTNSNYHAWAARSARARRHARA